MTLLNVSALPPYAWHYKDPGPYKYPAGTVSYEVDAPSAQPVRKDKPAEMPKESDMKAVKGMKGMKGM